MSSVLFGGLWGPLQDLILTVDSIARSKTASTDSFQLLLKRHKPDFISLFTNPAPDARERSQVLAAHKDGILLPGNTTPRTLPKQFTQEVVLLSDVLKLSEMSCVELLLAGEEHLPRFPTLTRGLVAVLLYYDGKRSLAACLRTLVQMREGKTWTLGLHTDTVDIATSFTADLISEGLVNKILDVLVNVDSTTELEKLERGHAVGGATHRVMLREAIEEYRTSLAETLFCWSCQNPLPSSAVLKILSHLKKHLELDKAGKMDPPTLALLMTLIYSIDIEGQLDDTSDTIHQSLMLDPSFVRSFHQELTAGTTEKAAEGLIAVLHLAWAVGVNVTALSTTSPHLEQLVSEEEMLVDWALKHGAFIFLKNAIIGSSAFFAEEYYVGRIHTLFTSFLTHLPLRVGEMHAEVERQQDTTVKSDYEELLGVMCALYGGDSQGLCEDYWHACVPSTNREPNTKQAGLFKFIRVGAEQLSASMFVSYITFLKGMSTTPQSAKHCYNLLRSDSYCGAGNGLVTWDHFFKSLEQYLWNLQEQLEGVKGEGHAMTIPNITQPELEALDAVLTLTTHIITLDEDTRTTMFENTQWHVVSTLFGLLSCPVVPQLKGAIMTCMATFTKSPEITVSLWQQLEACQILPTVQSTSLKQGIKAELEDIESRNETYPETAGFLTFLRGLLSVSVPGTLGAGYRIPGFGPYLAFVRDSVFLKFDVRAYSNQDEMWRIASSCMETFYILLDQFQINESDIDDTIASPGCTLLVHLLNDSPLLLKIMSVIESAALVLNKAEKLAGGHLMATQSSVKLLCLVLDIQDELLTMLREYNTSVLVAPLQQLLLRINPNSNNSDFMLHIIKLLSPSNTHIDIVQGCLKLLTAVCSKPGTLSPVSTLITQKSALSQELMQSLVERLETDDPESAEGIAAERNAVRQDVLALLLKLLDHPPPNIGYSLLGFDITRPLEKTVLQEPGIQGCQRTCLHSIIDLLHKELPPSPVLDTPLLTHLCYQLLLRLAVNRHTGSSVLRYLRTTHDFFSKFLEIHPSPDVDRLRHQCEFLQLLALELLVTSRSNLTSYLQRLIAGLSGANSNLIDSGPFSSLQGSRKLLSLLQAVCISVEPVSSLELNYFDAERLEGVLRQHQKKEEGLIVIDPVGLHKSLQSELNFAQVNIPPAQRSAISQEIKLILNNTVERNLVRKKLHLKRRGFDAWRQVVEVMIVGCPVDLVPSRQSLLVELTQGVLVRSRDGGPLAGLLSPASGAVVLLVQQLRLCSQLTATSQRVSTEGCDPLPPGLMQTIARNLVEAALQCGGNMQQARAHLYAALLHCLKMAVSADTDDVKMAPTLAQGYQLVDTDCLAVLCSYGDIFIESLCKDASKGHGVTKILSFSLLSIILGADSYQTWLRHLTNKGYLKHFIESIGADNQALIAGLSTHNIKPLFIYEAKLAFLTQLAQTEVGSHALLEAGLLPRLTELTILHCISCSSELYKQSQLVLPAFTLLTSVLTSLGARHAVANRQASHFVCSHSELISSILKEGQRTDENYHDLRAVTSLLAVLKSGGKHDFDKSAEDVAISIQLASTSTQLQRHMLNLLSTIQLPSKSIKADTDLTIQTLKLQIVTNSTTYCCSAMGSSNPLHILFSPDLGIKSGSHSLELLISLLQKATDGCSHHADTYRQLLHKAMHVNQMSTEEQRELASQICTESDKLSASQRTKYTVMRLEQLADKKDLELSLYTQLIENLVFLLWRHLDHYLSNDTSPRHVGEPLNKKLTLNSHNDNVRLLLRDLPIHLTDAFMKKVVDICTNKTSSSVASSFTSAVIRRIRKLISV